MAKSPTTATPAQPPKPRGAPTPDATAQFDKIREEAMALREVADKAEEAAQAKYEELVQFATENGITEEAEGEDVPGDDSTTPPVPASKTPTTTMPKSSGA